MTTTKFNWTTCFGKTFSGALPFIEVSDGIETYCAELGEGTPDQALASFRETYDWNLDEGEVRPTIDPVTNYSVWRDGTALQTALATTDRDNWQDDGAPEQATEGTTWDFDGWARIRRDLANDGAAKIGGDWYVLQAETTFNVEILNSHPRAGSERNYENEFHGGLIWKEFKTWDLAVEAAKTVLAKNDACTTAYVTERRHRGGAARPLVRWQCWRTDFNGATKAGEIIATEGR